MDQNLPDLLRARDETTRQLLSSNPESAREAERAITVVRDFLGLCVAFHEDIGLGARFDAISLLSRTYEILVSAYSLACQRAYNETFILLRIALETASTAFAITDDAELYMEYSSKGYKFKSTPSISRAKKAVGIIGEIYGALSNATVHPNKRIYGPRFENNEDGKPNLHIRIGSYEPYNPLQQDWIILVFICLVASIVTRLAELLLLEQIGDDDTHFYIPGSKYEILTSSKSQIVKYWHLVTHRGTWPSKT